MADDSAPINLTNHFLIAMPGLADQTFAKSVVYLCEHSDRGALGLMINKPSDITLSDLFDKVDLTLGRADLRSAPVFQGGPVQTERGFVLHDPLRAPPGSAATSPATGDVGVAAETAETAGTAEAAETTEPEPVYASTLMIPGGLEMTTSRDVLEALSTGAGPARVLVSLGYSAWAQGQLESEIGENSWLIVPADPAVIFETPVEKRYDRALSLLGLETWMLAPDAGHA